MVTTVRRAGATQMFSFDNMPDGMGTLSDSGEPQAQDPDTLISTELRAQLAEEQQQDREPNSLWEKFRAAALREMCDESGVIFKVFNSGTPVVVGVLISAIKTVLASSVTAVTGTALAALAGVNLGPVVLAVLALLIMKIGLDMVCDGYRAQSA